jgi:hypothetical protein
VGYRPRLALSGREERDTGNHDQKSGAENRNLGIFFFKHSTFSVVLPKSGLQRLF